MYTSLALPFRNGISRPPRRIINCGGSGLLIIVVLVSHNQWTQHVLGNQYEQHAGDEAINGIEARPVLPFEEGVLVERFR
tara:strand:+ start:1697 stop:1936 length:240 start_codon:yes stop_codon:yes gene_type:complete